MKKTKLLNDKLSSYISKLGHGDMTCVSDAGLPIPENVNRIDLAIKRGLPTLFDVIDAISSEAIFEKIIIANELNNKKEFIKKIKNILGDIEVIECSHEKLKETNKQSSKAIVRTGENTPYYNVILVSGVLL